MMKATEASSAALTGAREPDPFGMSPKNGGVYLPPE